MLPNLLKNNGEKGQSFFALRIAKNRLQGAIWVQQEKLEVLAITVFTSWQNEDSDSLVTETDLLLGQCVERLPSNYEEPKNVLLGTPLAWMESGAKIQQPYREKLKKMCDEMKLKPYGSVGVSEAVVNFLSKHDGMQESLLINIDGDIEASWVQQGVIVKSTITKINGSFEDAAMDGILKLEISKLPNRVYLMGVDIDLLPLKKQLEILDWRKLGGEVEIVILPVNLPMEAIIYATQSKAPSLPIAQAESQTQNQVVLADQPKSVNEPMVYEAVENEEKIIFPESENVETSETWSDEIVDEYLEDFNDESISKMDTKEDDLIKWGYVRNADIRQITRQASLTPKVESEENSDVLPKIEQRTETPLIVPTESQKVTIKPSVRYERKRSFPWIKMFLILVIVAFIIGLSGGLGYLIYANSKASVTLLVGSEIRNAEIDVLLDSQATSPDVANGIMNAKIVEVNVESSVTVPATGTDLIGQKSTGSVTVFNDTDTERNLDKGTKFTTQDKKLVFVLDTAIKIASKSVDLSSDTPFTPGKATAQVTAEKIGSDYNISAQTPLNVANFSASVMIARAEKAFSGGSSQEIQVVSKGDRASASEKLKTQLTAKGKADAQNNLEPGVILIPASETIKFGNQTFSSETGDQASSLSVSGSLDYKIVGYRKADFEQLAVNQLINQIPQGFDKAGDVSTELTELPDDDKTDSQYPFKVKAKIVLIPKIDIASVSQKLAGNKLSEMSGYLDSLPQVEKSNTTIEPTFLETLGRYPPSSQNISISIRKL